MGDLDLRLITIEGHLIFGVNNRSLRLINCSISGSVFSPGALRKHSMGRKCEITEIARQIAHAGTYQHSCAQTLTIARGVRTRRIIISYRQCWYIPCKWRVRCSCRASFRNAGWNHLSFCLGLFYNNLHCSSTIEFETTSFHMSSLPACYYNCFLSSNRNISL